MSDVPCNGCTICCKNSVIPLTNRDDPKSYDCYETIYQGRPMVVLSQRSNGDCVYLGPSGCTIHGRAPVMCRMFDCRELYKMHDRAGRKRLVREKKVSQETFDRARELLASS